MEQATPKEPRFLSVFSFSLFALLKWLRQFGVVLASLFFLAISLIIILRVMAAPREKHAELPSMYNSIGIQVSHSPFDDKFRRAAVAGGGGQWARVVSQGRQIGDPVQRMQFIHRFVTGNIQYTDDVKLYGTNDYWATPSETLIRGRGDCEDFAILEMMLLQTTGIPRSDIFLTVGYDLVARRDHALLSVRVGNNLWTLDQRAAAPFPTTAMMDFRPILTLGNNHVWLHGFRKQESKQTTLAGL